MLSSFKKHTKLALSKEEFIKLLSTSTPEEINKFIIEQGKRPKLIEPIVFIDPKTGAKLQYPEP